MFDVVLDTETTGLSKQNDRIIEIAAQRIRGHEITDEVYSQFVNPGDVDISPEAQKVHGISMTDVADKPAFSEIMDDFVAFIKGGRLIIHNAPFDVGFLNAELHRAGHRQRIEDICVEVVDTLTLARKMFPGRRNSLDALCQRYSIDKSQRVLHGALIDTNLLAQVYLCMTNSQSHITLEQERQIQQDVSDEQWRTLAQDMIVRSESELTE